MSLPAGARLVVFGCGYVGTAVAVEAIRRGLRVLALTRNAAVAVTLRQQGIEVVVADLATDAWHEAVPGGAEFVLNCVSAGGGGAEAYRRSYVEGMASIRTWLRRHGRVGTLVYTSSTSVYPQGGGARVDESATIDAATASDRAKLLLAAEDELRGASDEIGRWFILRLAGIYGPGRHHLVEQVRSGEVSGLAETHLNLIHRDDIVAVVFACFSAPEGVRNEIFTVVDDAPARKGEVVAWLAQKLGVAMPGFTGRPVGSRREITPDRILSNGKLKATLGWVPRFADAYAGYRSLGLGDEEHETRSR